MRAAAVAGGTGLSAGAEVRRESPGSGAPGGVFPPRRAQGVLRGHKGAADALRAAGGGGSGGPGRFRIGASGKFRCVVRCSGRCPGGPPPQECAEMLRGAVFPGALRPGLEGHELGVGQNRGTGGAVQGVVDRDPRSGALRRHPRA